MRAEVAVEVLVVAGAFWAGAGGMERSRRIPWLYQRVVLVARRDSSTALRPLDRLRSAQNDTDFRSEKIWVMLRQQRRTPRTQARGCASTHCSTATHSTVT